MDRQDNCLTGTWLARLIPDWLANSSKACDCETWRAMLDEWGCEKCEAEKERIVEHLLGEASKIEKLKYVPSAAKKQAALLLVNAAILAAKKNS